MKTAPAEPVRVRPMKRKICVRGPFPRRTYVNKMDPREGRENTRTNNRPARPEHGEKAVRTLNATVVVQTCHHTFVHAPSARNTAGEPSVQYGPWGTMVSAVHPL